MRRPSPPWERKAERAHPRQWLVWVAWRLVGRPTVVLNADFGVAQVEDGYLALLTNADDGDALLDDVRGLGVPGRGRLAGGDG